METQSSDDHNIYELQKNLAESLQESLSGFVGRKLDADTLESIRESAAEVVKDWHSDSFYTKISVETLWMQMSSQDRWKWWYYRLNPIARYFALRRLSPGLSESEMPSYLQRRPKLTLFVTIKDIVRENWESKK